TKAETRLVDSIGNSTAPSTLTSEPSTASMTWVSVRVGDNPAKSATTLLSLLDFGLSCRKARICCCGKAIISLRLMTLVRSIKLTSGMFSLRYCCSATSSSNTSGRPTVRNASRRSLVRLAPESEKSAYSDTRLPETVYSCTPSLPTSKTCFFAPNTIALGPQLAQNTIDRPEHASRNPQDNHPEDHRQKIGRAHV